MHLHPLGSTGPDVVLIHGIPGSAKSWWGSAELLATSHRVWVPDLLGFGESPRSSSLEAESQAAALDRALAEAQVTKASIVGHDFGGPIAMSLYRRRPQLFESLTLMATNAFPDTPIPIPLSAVTWPIVGDAMSRIVFSKPSLRAMLWRYGGSQLGDPAAVRTIFTGSLRELEARYRDYPAILQTVDVPTLIVWGDNDPFFPIEMAYRIGDLLRDVTVITLAGGHFLPETHPSEIAALVSELVRRQTRCL